LSNKVKKILYPTMLLVIEYIILFYIITQPDIDYESKAAFVSLLSLLGFASVYLTYERYNY
jgi:hypothetical protein